MGFNLHCFLTQIPIAALILILFVLILSRRLYVKQFILSLRTQNLLTYNASSRSWSFDVEEILQEMDASPTVVAFLTKRLLGKAVITSPTKGGVEIHSGEDHRRQELRIWMLPRIAALGTVFSLRVFDILFEEAMRSCSTYTPNELDDKSDWDHFRKMEKRAFVMQMESDGVLAVKKKHNEIRWTHDKVRFLNRPWESIIS